MGKEILTVVAAVSAEKGVSREVIFEALEAALVSVTRKRYDEGINVKVSIDRESGDYETFRYWVIVDDADVVMEEDQLPIQPGEPQGDESSGPHLFNPEGEILLSTAIARDKESYIGQVIEEVIVSEEFGRIAAQTAKQVIVQHVRDAERTQIISTYQSRIGELVMGTVKRLDRGNVVLDLGGNNIEAQINRDEIIPREIIRPGDRLRTYLRAVSTEPRGPQLLVSRTSRELMIQLFTLEVPEIGEGLIEIVGCARDPGLRAKIGVRSKIPRVDPVGACVGMRGSRVQAVSNELSGERVDIIPWDENPAQYVINAMSPVDVVSIVVDEERKSMDVAVQEEQLSQAIGRGGQNVRLASQLCGWDLNVMTVQQADEKNETESAKYLKLFMDQLDVDEEIAQILIQEGFTSMEELAYISEHELQQIEEFNEDIAIELQTRARDVLLRREIAMEENVSTQVPAEDLLFLDGMDTDLAYNLARKGIGNREALAELATDDLLEIADIDPEHAAGLIMKARAIWFEDESNVSDPD